MFTNFLGLNPNDFSSVLGGDTSGGRGSTAQANSLFPIFVMLSRDDMLKIDQYYGLDPLIARANELKSEHNLGKTGFEIIFAGKTVVDDAKYHHEKALNIVLERAREMKDKFGFVMYQDSAARLEDEVREIVGAPIKDEDDKDASKYINPNANSIAVNSLPVVDTEETLTEVASKYIHRAATALGLTDVRERLLKDMQSFEGMLQASVENSTSGSVYPQTGPALPRIPIGALDERTNATTTMPPSDTLKNFESTISEAAANTKRDGFERIFSRIRDIKLVDFRDGDIYVRINQATNTRDLVFCRRVRTREMSDSERASEEQKAAFEKRLPSTVIIDTTVKFFVWRMPSDEGALNSPMVEAIKKLWAARDADRRRVQADEYNVRPTVLLTYEDNVKLGDMRDMTEQEMLDFATRPTAKQENANAQEILGRFIAGKTIDVLNRKSRSELDREIVAGSAIPNASTPNGKPTFAGISTSTGARIAPLPRGYKPAMTLKADSTDDPESKMVEYQEHISMMTGIPLIQLKGGVGNSRTGSAKSSGGGASSSAVTGGSAELSGALFRPAIMKDRNDLANFVEEMLDEVFHNMSNEELARLLATTRTVKRLARVKHDALLETLREQYALVTDAAETIKKTQAQQDSTALLMALITQFQQIADAAMSASKLEYRFTINFKKQKFLDDTEIEQLKHDGAVSEYQAANMKRSRLGLPEITEEEFEKNRQAQLKRKQEETIAAQPPPPPAAITKKAKKAKNE